MLYDKQQLTQAPRATSRVEVCYSPDSQKRGNNLGARKSFSQDKSKSRAKWDLRGQRGNAADPLV